MKNVTVHCPVLSNDDYSTVLQRLCTESVKNVTVYIRATARTTPKQIESMIDAQKQFCKNRTVRFQNHCVFTQIPHLYKSLRRVLRKNSFWVDITVQKKQFFRLKRISKRLEKLGIAYKFWLDETADQYGAYKLFSAHGLNINFVRPIYTDKTPELFDKWLYDPLAKGVNTFCDIINMLAMQTHSQNCRYASCFGNTFNVDKQLNVYLCPIHADSRTLLGSLKQAENLESLLNCQAVADLLPTAVQKRQQCVANCKSFHYCQGGCPLESENNTGCDYYCATVEKIRQRLLEVYRDGKIRQVNYIVKNAILNALAFGTAFFD